MKVIIDDRVRLMNAVLLLTEFVNENANWKPHDLKVAALDHLKPYTNHPCIAATRTLAESHWMDSFYGYAIRLIREDGIFTPPSGSSFLLDDPDDTTYARLLNDFLADSQLVTFWSDTRDMWEKAIGECKTILEECGFSQFIYEMFDEIPPIVIVPNPADPSTFGFGPSDGRIGYAIIGPPAVAKDSSVQVKYSQQPDYVAQMAFHECIHTLWGAVRHNEGWIVDHLQPLAKRMELKDWFPERYPDWASQLDELFIRAATTLFMSRLTGEEYELAELKQDAEQFGIEPVLDFYHALKEFLHLKAEDKGRTFQSFLPELAKRVLSAT